MDEFDTLPNHLFISLRHEFQATRVIGQRLSPTKIKIKVDVQTLEDDTDDYAVRMEVALAKISYWVEKVLDGSILIAADNEWASCAFLGDQTPLTTNNVMLCPEEPTDALLCELILCKFKALTQGSFEFMAIDIHSTDARGMSFTFVGGTPGESFPQGAEWLTDTNYFSKPWWHRADASTLDIVPEEGANLNEPPQWAYSLSFIAESMVEPESIPANVVVRPEFRPQVIEGGKVD